MRARTSSKRSSGSADMASLRIGDEASQLLDAAGDGPGDGADGAALVLGDVCQRPAVQPLEDDRLGVAQPQPRQGLEQSFALLGPGGLFGRRRLLARQPEVDAGGGPL